VAAAPNALPPGVRQTLIIAGTLRTGKESISMVAPAIGVEATAAQP
jgi:hypothetical protein